MIIPIHEGAMLDQISSRSAPLPPLDTDLSIPQAGQWLVDFAPRADLQGKGPGAFPF
ncbi:hypothetical protein M407DRAFT_244835 [Tulasnella calospora MUT 4182]|uniref:Uncharacterized protein n=1 Tax=Tulasnella calospora MUT 4182 TaxID=1051891 RepID=A0A0C3KPI6_9AGAM|nr:hypothetical protein M407DRAFT_244835 [Tulasnella calospora MUT 4182]